MMSRAQERAFVRSLVERDSRRYYYSPHSHKRYNHWLIWIDHPLCTCLGEEKAEKQSYTHYQFNKKTKKFFYKLMTENGHDTELHLILPSHITQVIVFDWKEEPFCLYKQLGRVQISLQ